ncbi:DMT family transporter [Klebsiella pneumoniae]|uniref:SMR family multidrug resistance protein n=1 Tax=Klebsiella pneumoniae subsp. ozaenae TaxID=574 RepID=A0A378UCL1_KLEPO|nr:SMR family multidrug resistance protein [Klebsiella pneumoniae subsp. ozaenae]HBY9737798.1 QacE family quaternary ammonium compound efflux SMR transporter [Klebsiella pneumoniae]HBY9798233.1 QacE family quaternary ammonium compound efflux SMR transporter [Klebsiella pneumoniae]HBY9803299.1 QacE family quaternary ammonium compound efflux SMR transporter [Klebsiella pneumoniae]
MSKYWFFLFSAILLEVIASSFLKSSSGFKVVYLGIFSLLLYGASFYILSLVLTRIPFGIAYAIWSGVGVILVSLIGVVIYKDTISISGYIGIGIITSGVIITCLSTLETI